MKMGEAGVVVAYAVTVALATVVAHMFHLSDLMYAFLPPVLFASIAYRRRAYVLMYLVILAASLLVIFRLSPNVRGSLTTITTVSVVLIVMAETLHRSSRTRRRAEEALRESEARYRSLTESLPVGLFRNTLDTAGRFIMVNSAVVQMHGYSSAEELLKLPVSSLYRDPKDREKISKEILAKGRVERRELALKKKDGTPIWGLVTVRVVHDEKGNPAYFDGIVEDITARKQAEETIAEQRLKMEASARLSSLGAMASGMAHEVNNPLAIISVAVEQVNALLKAPVRNEHLMQRCIGSMTRNVSRIERIIRSLRNFSRDGADEPFTNHALSSLLEDALELCRERFQAHGIILGVKEVAPNLTMECRSTQIAQVIMNLLNNAQDAVEHTQEKWVRLEVRDEGDVAELRISDSGAGIPAELRERIFEPFFTTKEVGKGTGLGLSISRAIIEDHGGSFELDTRSQNTCFAIRLPKQQAAAVPTSAA